MGAIVVLCMVPDAEAASRIARALVGERLAACVNCLPGATSTYRWQGEVRSDAESMLVIKTTAARYRELQARIVALHPYELPEVIAVDVCHGLGPYLAWVEGETQPAQGDH